MNDVRETTPGAMLRRCGTLMLACGVIALAGCGGGGGGDAPPPPPPPAPDVSVSGWVGERSAWAQAEVMLACADGSARQASTAADGRYTATLPAAALPCLVRARTSDNTMLWSAATTAGAVNVTTLSNLLVARALQYPTNGLYGDAQLARRLTSSTMTAAESALRAALADVDLGTSAAPITTPISNVTDDPLVRANGRLLDHLAGRGVTSPTLVHAFAYQRDPALLRIALAQADLRRLLALPPTFEERPLAPLVVRRGASPAGSSTAPFLLMPEVTLRSVDGGQRWEPIDLVLADVTSYRGRLFAVTSERLVTSDDDGSTWRTVDGVSMAGWFARFVKPADGRLWILHYDGTTAFSSGDGLAWQAATATDDVRDARAQPAAHRAPPLRSVSFDALGNLRSCLGTACSTVRIADWPEIASVQVVQGSDELVAFALRDGNEHLAISSDGGLTWRSIPNTEITSEHRVLRTSTGRLIASASSGYRTLDDDKGPWTSSTSVAANEWRSLGAASTRRSSDGYLEISTDSGRTWREPPLWPTGEVDANRVQSPAGVMLRGRSLPREVQVQISFDGGQSWSVVPGPTSHASWLGDRFAALSVDLWTSRDGLVWMKQAIDPAHWLGGRLVGDGRTWLWQHILRPSNPQSYVLESVDEGRTWSGPDLPPVDSPWYISMSALGCDGAVFVSQAGLWQRTYPSSWRKLPPGPAGFSAHSCQRGLLIASAHPSDRFGAYASADRGMSWVSLGRPGTNIVYDAGRWWSVGESSITLWPQ